VSAVRRDGRLKIVVGSVFSLPPFSPGIAWDWLHLVLGLRELGHDVVFVEQVEPDWCRDREGRACPWHRSVNRAHFARAMARFGLSRHACQIYDGGAATEGLGLRALRAAVRHADLLVNVSGHVTLDWLLGAAQRRVYFDQDPVFTQLWMAEYGKQLNFAPDDLLLTVGLNVGTSESPVPDCGLRWHACLPAVVLRHWPHELDLSCRRFTTIASFGSYSELRYRGARYGCKRSEFRRLAELPARVQREVEVALKAPADDPDAALLRRSGWSVVDAGPIDTLERYQAYIAGSRAEIGIAKHAYVHGRSGWFSDRAAHYLASGKPVLAQSTGFEAHVPTGAGLLAFADLDEAAEGIEAIDADYPRHARAARAFAEEFLDHRKVLPAVTELAMS
jgi:hypothetical protein